VTRVPVHRPPVRRLAAALPVVLVALALGGGVAACAEPGHTDAPSQAGAAAATATTGTAIVEAMPSEAPVAMGAMHMPTADEVRVAWEARPAYVRDLPGEWQQAYAYALARPDVLQWLPCHCGCGGMGHRSNLDCFFQRREVRGNYAFEEHASYCDICVDTANLAARMLREGSTMAEVRAAVDREFSGAAPGTDTPLPPA
jgi:hypothetical protein